MLEAGFAVGLGLLVTFAKIGWKWRMRMLSNPVAMDLIVFVFLMVLHWGTFSGVMAATVGALMVSLVLSAGRWYFGHVERGVYVPGVRNVKEML